MVSPAARLPWLPSGIAALALVVTTIASASGYIWGDLRPGEFYLGLGMWIWISLPWAVYLLWARTSPRGAVTVVIGLLMTALYAFIYIQVFFFPQSSTDGIAIVIAPMMQFLIIAAGEVFGLLLHTRGSR
jgi:hypothetical protein